MNLGVVLPCTLLYGGVKRFMELGNIFIEMGHRFTVYSPDAQQPDWFDFKGEVKLFEALNTVSLKKFWELTPNGEYSIMSRTINR